MRAPACTAPSSDFGRPAMRRHEPTLDPAVAAELEALEAALAGHPAAEPGLAALVRDVRAEAPAMAPDFRARLDRRVERGFERGLRRRRLQALRPVNPPPPRARRLLAAPPPAVPRARRGADR